MDAKEFFSLIAFLLSNILLKIRKNTGNFRKYFECSQGKEAARMVHSHPKILLRYKKSKVKLYECSACAIYTKV